MIIEIPEWIVYAVLFYFAIDAALNITNIYLKLKIKQVAKTVENIRQELRDKEQNDDD